MSSQRLQISPHGNYGMSYYVYVKIPGFSLLFDVCLIGAGTCWRSVLKCSLGEYQMKVLK